MNITEQEKIDHEMREHNESTYFGERHHSCTS